MADLPENTHLFYEVVKSLDALNRYKGWDGGTSYYCYVRLTDPVAADKIEGHSRQFLGKYIHWENELELHLQPLKKLYLLYSGENVVERMVLLSVLALVMLLVSGLNYVLLSISSIGRRTKLIGIHKVNGAAGKDHFGGNVLFFRLFPGPSFGFYVVYADRTSDDRRGETMENFFVGRTVYDGGFFVGFVVDSCRTDRYIAEPGPRL